MYVLRRFAGDGSARLNAIINELNGHLTGRINLIGSATLPLPAVCEASALPGSSLRVEGHRDVRYFPGTQAMDATERLIEEAVSTLFGIPEQFEVSAQPHAATQANHAVWRAFLKPGDLVLGLSLEDGGHISHVLALPEGVRFEAVPMVADTGVDYDALHAHCIQERPAMIIAGGSSYPLAMDYPRLGETAKACGARLHADLAHTASHVAAGLHPPATPHADTITIDTGKTLRGPKGGILVFRREDRVAVRRALFPLEQSSPNQSAMFAKAALFCTWLNSDIADYARNLTRDARTFQAGIIKAGLSPVFSQTDCHIVLIDLTGTGLSGREAEERLAQFKVLANRNTIPGETRKPWIASGLRFGTTTLTVLGYEPAEIEALAGAIGDVLFDRGTPAAVIDTLIERRQSDLCRIVEPNSASELTD